MNIVVMTGSPNKNGVTMYLADKFIGGAEKAGNSRDRILAALVHAMPYMGIPRLFNALNAAREAWAEA